MNDNIAKFPDRSVVEEEAAAWLIRLDSDRAPSSDELASLREWLARSPAHLKELNNLASLWGRMNVLTELSVPLGKPDVRKRWISFEKLNPTPFGGLRAGTAAVILVGIAIGLTLWLRPDPLLAMNGLYATAVGQQQSTTLADGSVVVLNTNSQIRVDYTDDYRDIRLLQGEAHFTVAKNADKPFRVYAGNGRVQAAGTAFSVHLLDQAISVTVTEGRVAVASLKRAGPSDNLPQAARSANESSPPGSTARLEDVYVETLASMKAGESALIPSDAANQFGPPAALGDIETVEASELAKRLSWREGLLTFTGDPLEDVVSEISRYTTISIEISDPNVRAIKIGGQFPIGETEAMFDALEVNFGLRVIRLSHDHVLLSAAEE